MHYYKTDTNGMDRKVLPTDIATDIVSERILLAWYVLLYPDGKALGMQK